MFSTTTAQQFRFYRLHRTTKSVVVIGRSLLTSRSAAGVGGSVVVGDGDETPPLSLQQQSLGCSIYHNKNIMMSTSSGTGGLSDVHHYGRRLMMFSTFTTTTTNNNNNKNNKNDDKNDKLQYDDETIRHVLETTKTIAMIGASPKWNRPSYFAMKYLQGKDYRVIPVNPMVATDGDEAEAEAEILGEKVYASLTEIPTSIRIDMVDIFRGPSHVPGIVEEAMKRGDVRYIWMQLGIRHEQAASHALSAPNTTIQQVIMNRCPKIEFSRLFGELGWLGFDSNIICSKRPTIKPTTTRTTTTTTKKTDNDNDDKSLPLPTFEQLETKLIHSGTPPCAVTGARIQPIYQTTSYVFDNVDHASQLFNLQAPGNIYSRLTNPTVSALEQKLASIEGGRGATCTSSGHSAQFLALFPLMDCSTSGGDNNNNKFISSDKLYGGSLTQFSKTFRKFGWQCEFVNVDDIDSVKRVLEREAAQSQDGNGNNIKGLFCESLANPGGTVTDLEALAFLCDEFDIPLIVDNTLATPVLCRPIDWVSQSWISTHSTTKFICGHGNSLGGCVIDSGTFQWDAATIPAAGGRRTTKFPSLSQPEEAYHGLTFTETFGDLAYTTYCHAVGLRDIGPTMSPMNAFLTLTGCETLSLRMERHVENALTLAKWLDDDPRVAWVSYAGLESSPYYELGQKYTGGGGAVFTFGLHGGYEAGVRVVERVRLFSHLANMGDTRSLILHPASTTHRQLTEEMRTKAGAGDDVMRLSVGLEHIDDLIQDLDYALG